MVEITRPRPQQQIEVGSRQVDSEAITEEAIAAGAADDLEPSDLPSGFGGQTPTEKPADSETLGGPLPPTWENPRTQRSRQIAMVVALAGSGLIASALMFGWFIKNWQSTDDPTAQQAPSAQQAPDEAAGDSGDIDPSNSDAAGTELQSDGATSEAMDSSDSDPQTTDPQMSDSADPNSVSPESPNVATDKAGEPTAMPGPPTMADTDAQPAIPSDLLTPSMLDPLGLDTPAKTPDFSAEPNEDDPPADGKNELPPEARKFVEIFNLEGGGFTPTLDAPAGMDDVQIDGPTNENIDPLLMANPTEPINFKRALATKLALAPAKNDQYPLNDLVLILSQVSGVPIQIDWVSFNFVGVDLRDGVGGLKGHGWKSVDEFLQLIASSVGGEITKTETMITLAPTETAFTKMLDDTLDLSDFGSGQTSAVAVINGFLVGDGQPGANAKQVKAGEERFDQQIAVLATEAMRRVRGLKGKLDDRILNRWAQSASNPRLDWPIVQGGDAGKLLLSPLTIAGLLRRIARQNDSTCFVNWDDAIRRDMAPQQLVMPFMGIPAGDVLKTTLQSFELQVRRVDQSHWWVGTEATYDRFPVVVWTDSLGQSQSEFSDRISKIGGDDDIKLAIDPDTGKAMLLLPRYIVRQLPKLLDGLK